MLSKYVKVCLSFILIFCLFLQSQTPFIVSQSVYAQAPEPVPFTVIFVDKELRANPEFEKSFGKYAEYIATKTLSKTLIYPVSFKNLTAPELYLMISNIYHD